MKTLYYRWLHRPIMRLSHRFNWHYAPTTHLQDGSKQQWCQWCGLRSTKDAVTSRGKSGIDAAIGKESQ